jgi:hypothetical protein
LFHPRKAHPEALDWKRGALVVRGRGADHQADVLGNFALTPAFSLPIRMFLEAKSYSASCGLPIVRNAHGVIHDVNENFVRPVGSPHKQAWMNKYLGILIFRLRPHSGQ